MRKIEKLKSILKSMERVVVAYSGGLDSSFLLKAAIDTLGKNNVLAVTACSKTYPSSEYREARAVAKDIGAKQLIIRTDELNKPIFSANPVNRCYYCKKELFKKLNDIKRKYGMDAVLDGTNLDDLKDIRFGMKAARELGVKSPLVESKITKNDIRKFSKKMRLSTWNKPSFACLASRIPFHAKITAGDLDRIARAEDYLKSLGFKQVRMRLHKDIARLEISKKDFARAVRFKELITKRLKRLGFTYVTLDLEGYRTGSMHEAV